MKLQEAAGTQQVLCKQQQRVSRVHTFRGRPNVLAARGPGSPYLSQSFRPSVHFHLDFPLRVAIVNLSGREQLCLEGEDPNLNQWEWAAEAGLLVWARRTALWAPDEVLAEEEKRGIKPPDRVPRAGVALRWASPSLGVG